MEHVTSADGTRIAVQHSGHGPALILVVGAFCDRTSTASLTAGLTGHFTVYEYDRRGRGDSGNQPGYAIERETEDLTAVIDSTGGPAAVFGHSSGGALALETAARGQGVTGSSSTNPPTIPTAPPTSSPANSPRWPPPGATPRQPNDSSHSWAPPRRYWSR